MIKKKRFKNFQEAQKYAAKLGCNVTIKSWKTKNNKEINEISYYDELACVEKGKNRR